MKNPLNRTPSAFLYILLSFFTLSVHGQAVTEIVTDFQGYWKTGVRPNVNPVSPNNSHNLLSFTQSGIRYSTGVNDAILTANGLVFTPGNYKALPISALSVAPTTSTYIGLGQLYDGVAGGATPPPPNNIPFYLTDGVNGLNLGTAAYNLPVSNLVFDVGLFNISRIGDGIPDIIVTQVGDIAAGIKDTLKFIDPSGNLVGIAIAVTFAGADTLGLIDNDFYNAWQNPMGFAAGFYPASTKRAVRLFAFELSDFGLNSSNFGNIDKFVHKLSGQSDQAFVAYNTSTIQILPNSNPGCFATLPGLWIKANDGTSTITNNQKMGSWQDRSPNTFAMEQPTNANQPLFKDATNSFNFNAYIDLNAANSMIAPNSPFTATNNNADIFIVGRPTNSSVKNKIIGFSRNATDYSGTGAGDFPAISYDATGRLVIDSGTVNLLTGTSANINKIVLQQINYTQGAGSNITISTNGSPDGSTVISKNLGTWTFQLGDMSPGDDGSDLDLAEVIVFPQNLSNSDRNTVESYLSIKYGLTSAHDYTAGSGAVTWSIAGNSGYNNNIFGIGREDCQAMHRKQSKSINTDGLVTIGNTAITIDNASNFNQMTNGAYSFMGDNGGSLNFQTTEIFASCYQRTGREWKVRETGTVGTILLQVPASTSTLPIKLPAASNNNMYLLVDNDGDFSAGIISIVPMVLNGTNWEGSYNFTDGNYYTFATDNGINSDQNDLPATWPAASAVINGCNTNGDAVINNTDQNSNRVMVWAGAAITSEATATTNATASADGADDGLQLPPVVSRYQNNIFTVLLNSNVAGTTVFYRMWIDWNADGNFGNDLDGNGNPASYAGSDVMTGAGTKSVTVNVLSPVGVNSNFSIRLIVSNAAIANSYIANSNFIYAISNGEVEDYFFPLSILPVTLERFVLVSQTCKVILKWTTASEQNSREFIIERSEDAVNFVSVGRVASQNNPGGAAYAFTDQNIATGNYYYRLKMTDIDGHSEYSATLTTPVNCDHLTINVMPNPAKDHLTIEGLAGNEMIIITDLAGRIVFQHKTTVNPVSFDISKLAAGTYIIQITKNGRVLLKQKFIKLQ